MTVLLFLVMSYQYFGPDNHEIAGTVMFVLFILHHLMNLSWYKNLGKGKYSSNRIFQLVVDGLLFLDMIGLMVSGIGMSRYVFRFLDLNMSQHLARNLHMVTSHGGFLLMGLHIGLHYGMILGMMRKAFHITQKSTSRTWILRMLAVAVSGYGIYALIKRNFISYMLLRVQFAFFDYGELPIFYEWDLFAMMCFMIFIGYYLQKLMLSMKRR